MTKKATTCTSLSIFRTNTIVTSSDSLHYCLQYDWGGDTLAVNGRYQVPLMDHARRRPL
jgi:hypothetical protein